MRRLIVTATLLLLVRALVVAAGPVASPLQTVIRNDPVTDNPDKREPLPLQSPEAGTPGQQPSDEENDKGKDKHETEPLQSPEAGTPGQQPSDEENDKGKDKPETEPLRSPEAGTPGQQPLETRDQTADKPAVPATAPAKPQGPPTASRARPNPTPSPVTRRHGSRHTNRKIVCDDLPRLSVSRIKTIREGYRDLDSYYEDQLASDLPTLMTADVETSFQGPYAFKAALDMAEFYNNVVFPDAIKDPELTNEVRQTVIKVWLAVLSLSQDMKTCYKHYVKYDYDTTSLPLAYGTLPNPTVMAMEDVDLFANYMETYFAGQMRKKPAVGSGSDTRSYSCC